MGCTVPSARHFALLVLFLASLLQGDSRLHNAVRVPSAQVVGTLYCDTCSDQQSNKLGHFISGASVEVQCKDESNRTAFRKTAITDLKGLLKFNIPPEVQKNTQSIKNCTFGLLKTSHPTFCDAVGSIATTSAIEVHHKSTRKDGIKVYSAGAVTLKPQKKPAVCDEEIEQAAFFFPPNPLAPPNIGGIPIPQNPLVPPPLSLLPPGLAPTPPSLIPPGLPLLPSPPSQKLLPPLPILEPPPSSPPPALPILPPGLPLIPPGLPLIPPGLPLIPPGFPGVPPSFPLEKEDSP